MTLEATLAALFSSISTLGWIGIIVFFSSVVIQVSPIKINPWSWIARKVGSACNKETNDAVKDLNEVVVRLQHICEETDAKVARERILWFGDELIFAPEKKHSKDRFDSVLAYITEYDNYCADHPEFKNHITGSTTKMIMEVYERCMREHTFL